MVLIWHLHLFYSHAVVLFYLSPQIPVSMSSTPLLQCSEEKTTPANSTPPSRYFKMKHFCKNKAALATAGLWEKSYCRSISK